MAAIGQRLRERSPQIPWFGTRPGDHFDAPLLNALAALFEHGRDAWGAGDRRVASAEADGLAPLRARTRGTYLMGASRSCS